jgi:ABC-2 type transport system ATP-binding protein
MSMANPTAVPQPYPPEPSILHPASGRTTPPALRVVDLRKEYGPIEAVAGLSFQIEAGEVFGLLGPNGAGKTTTISVVATQIRPSGGDALVFDHSVRDEIAAVRTVIGVVPQDLSIYPKLTAAENVRFFGRMYGVEKRELERRVNELLGLVGLDARRDDYAGSFSGGMKRRLNLAVGLVHRPRLLLLDEPTVGIDPHSREHIFDIVRHLRGQGAAILYTTHYMEEAEALCDRLGIMDEGNIIATGTLQELLSEAGCAEVVEVRGLTSADALRRLQGHPAVCRMETGENVTRMYVVKAAHLLAPLQQALGSQVHNVSVQIAPLSLGNLFLQLTGKKLRD